jgi:Na+/alanine symporter
MEESKLREAFHMEVMQGPKLKQMIVVGVSRGMIVKKRGRGRSACASNQWGSPDI